jgi:hypothetical protein
MALMREGLRLFSPDDLNGLVQTQIEKAHSEVLQKDAEELLSMPVDDQLDIIIAHFGLVLPTLREDLAHSEEPQETVVRLSDYGQQISVPGAKYHIEIPFEGDARLFRHFPAMRSSEPPRP